MSIFMNEEKFIEIIIFYSNKENSVDISTEEKDGYEKAIFKFKHPNWHDHIQIMSRSTIIDGNTGSTIINPFIAMDEKFKLLLSEWSSSESINNETIGKIHPKIMQFVVSELEKRIN